MEEKITLRQAIEEDRAKTKLFYKFLCAFGKELDKELVEQKKKRKKLNWYGGWK